MAKRIPILFKLHSRPVCGLQSVCPPLHPMLMHACSIIVWNTKKYFQVAFVLSAVLEQPWLSRAPGLTLSVAHGLQRLFWLLLFVRCSVDARQLTPEFMLSSLMHAPVHAIAYMQFVMHCVTNQVCPLLPTDRDAASGLRSRWLL